MKLEMFQKVKLQNGKAGHIIEIFNDGEAYMVEVKLTNGEYRCEDNVYPTYEELTISPKDIQSVIVEVEKPFAIA